MTEHDWLACTDPWRMLDFLSGEASRRKRRLFATACVRRVALHWNGFGKFYLAALDENEQYADTYPDGQDAIRSSQRRVASEQKKLAREHHDEFPYHYTAICRAMRLVLDPTGLDLARIRVHVRDALGSIFELPVRQSEERVQLALFHDIFGTSLCPTTFDPAWLSPAVKNVAESIYAERSFGGLPILADALEDAGCTDSEILAHCRGAGPHVRGCRPLDLARGQI